MKTFRLVVTRIDSDRVVVVPFAKRLDFNLRRIFRDFDFVAFLEKLGIERHQADLTLDWSRPAPRSFELRLTLSEKQRRCLYSYFPLLGRLDSAA